MWMNHVCVCKFGIFWSPPVKRPQNDSFELWNVNSTQT